MLKKLLFKDISKPFFSLFFAQYCHSGQANVDEKELH